MNFGEFFCSRWCCYCLVFVIILRNTQAEILSPRVIGFQKHKKENNHQQRRKLKKTKKKHQQQLKQYK